MEKSEAKTKDLTLIKTLPAEELKKLADFFSILIKIDKRISNKEVKAYGQL
jgi:hypothetical protein